MESVEKSWQMEGGGNAGCDGIRVSVALSPLALDGQGHQSLCRVGR